MWSRYTLWALAAYLVAALAVTYPVPFQLTTHIAGGPGGDSFEFIWSIWWFKRALLDLHTDPLHISMLNHPDGLYFPLLPAMSQTFVLGLPLALLSSPAVAFNLMFLFSYPLCALAGYWLCYDLTQDRRAAFVGGLIWGFFPNKSGHALTGHLFQLLVFTLPIAILFVLRMLRKPSTPGALAAAVALGVAATSHPVNVAYFLFPVLLTVVVFALWPRPRSSWKAWAIESPLRWVLMSGAAGAVLALPLFLPTLLSRDQLGFLVQNGVVRFSLDLLSFVIPAPHHPFIVHPLLADLARRVAPLENEDIGYIGLVPAALAVMALRRRWVDGRPWLVLALVTATLSLGPVLHIGREIVRVTVEDDRFPVLMPYAFLGRLPFFQWSRTPARFNQTTMFAIAILSCLGMAAVMTQLKNARAAWALWFAACLIIPLEYLVRWPMPTVPIPDSPALGELARDSSFEAVMEFPVPDYAANMLALYHQTLHQHPMIGGRVYRDQPGTLIVHDFLSRTITATPGEDDIAPGPTAEQRTTAFNYFGVGRIIYQPASDSDGTARAALESFLGPPVASEDDVSLYTIPDLHSPTPDSFFIFGANWHPPERWQTPARWFHGAATLYLFSSVERTASIRFTAIPGRELRRLIVNVNGVQAGHFGAGDWAEYQTNTVTLHEGINVIEFVDEEGSWQYVGDPRCQGGSAVAGPFPVPVPCDQANRDARDLSLAIQNLQVVPESVSYSTKVIFGEALELLESSAPDRARPGDSVVLHLVWRAAQRPPQDFTMFLHLVDGAGNLAAGSDSPPARGGFPTSQWQPGQVVKYNVPLRLPDGIPIGTYTLRLGWYVWPSLDPLVTPDGSDSYALGTLQIAP